MEFRVTKVLSYKLQNKLQIEVPDGDAKNSLRQGKKQKILPLLSFVPTISLFCPKFVTLSCFNKTKLKPQTSSNNFINYIMAFTFNQKTSSPLSQFKEKIFGSPEEALKEAYQAALTIQCIEEEHFHGGRIPIESADNNPHFPSFLRESIAQSLNTLQQKTKEFNRSSSAVGKLGPNHLEKLILVEGILAESWHCS